MRVLLIESDELSSRSISLILQSENICADLATDGEEGLELAKLFDYDVILLSTHLSDMTGLDVLRKLRLGHNAKPVLVLSAQACIETKVRALNAGADDYLVRPFNREELVARLRALVRRSRGFCNSAINVGSVVLDMAAKNVAFDGRTIALTDKEYQILELLSLRRGVTVNRETLINHLYLDGEGPESNTIGLFVCKLRKKLAAATGDRLIETVRDRGYLVRAA